MANSTDKSILTAAGKALLAQLNAEEKALVIDKMIFANVPNRPEYPQPDDVVPTDHIVHQEQVEQRGRLSADSVIYSTTLTSDVGPFDFNWTGAYCSEYGVLVTIDHHALTPKTADEPGVAGNTLVRSVVLEYKDIAEITNITVDASSWQYNATERMKKMDRDVAQSIIDQNGKDWFIEDGFLVTPSGSAYSIKAGAGYVSGNRVAMEFDRSVQVPNKPSFIYIDAHREGTPTGEQVTLFNFVVTAEEKDDYIDSSTGKDVKHFVCKIAQVLADGSVSDLRKKNNIEMQAGLINNLHTARDKVVWSPKRLVTSSDSLKLFVYDNESIDFYLPNFEKLPFQTSDSFEKDIENKLFLEYSVSSKEWTRSNFSFYVNSREELETLENITEKQIVKIRNMNARFMVVKGVSPHPIVDLQSKVSPNYYFKLLPIEGTSYSFSFIGAGGKNDLTISDENSSVKSELIDKIMKQSPIIGGTIKMSGGQYWYSKSVRCPKAKHITIEGEPSTLSYNTYESKTIIYSDNSLDGEFVFDFDDTQFMGLVDLGFRGQLDKIPTKSAFFLGKKGEPTVGYGNALIERVNVHGFLEGGLLQNCGISVVRDYQASNCHGRGLALETSGDSCLYNIYSNTNNKDTKSTNLKVGTGLYIGRGSNNTSVFGGKLEFNSKGLVVEGSNGVTAIIQFDRNYMSNFIAKAINDNNMACRGVTIGGSRILSGGILEGYEKASIYTDSSLGAVSVNMFGGVLRAAGDGAFDNSDSGFIGAEIGIFAKGNSNYSNDVHFNGDGLYMGVSKSVKATGKKTKVVIEGMLEGNIDYEENDGAQVITKQNFKNLWIPSFTGDFGVCSYAIQEGETHVSNGVASVNFTLQLQGVGDISGDIRISGLKNASKSKVPSSMTLGVVGDVLNTSRISGLVEAGSTDILLWKENNNGEVSRLRAEDLTDSTLIRGSITFSV